ncbi:MAG: type II toxin-antitoxin system RelE/ParE family toxin [Ignavibacteria bacterium]|nr:type II toxin-antitoxin system RelE/ParE family toxin [Ignavibacteria bacterium]
MYLVKLSDKAVKELENISNRDYDKIRGRIINLESNPKSMGCIKLKSKMGYRVRTGDYRILYEVDEQTKVVYVYKIEHRKDVYRKR